MSQPAPPADPRVLGRLLAAYDTLWAFSCPSRLAEFVTRAVEDVPGISSCAVCMPAGQAPQLANVEMQECETCTDHENHSEQEAREQCPLSQASDVRVWSLRTQDRRYGFFLASVTEVAAFAPYEPFVFNLANSLAVSVELRWQKKQLEATNQELHQYRAHLQDLVKARTDELAKSEERYRSLVENTPDFIYALDRHGRHTAVNRSMCVAMGRPVEEILGKDHSELGIPVEVVQEWRAQHQRVLAGEVVRSETSMPMPGGQVRTHEMLLIPIRDATDGIVGIRGLNRDITEEKRLAAQFQQAQRMEAVGRLAGGVAHDFNNLITVIASFAGFVQADLRSADPMYADVEEILNAARRAGDLTQQLLAFSRKSVVEPKRIDLSEVVTDIEKMLRRVVGENIALFVKTSTGLWPVWADVGKVEQVLTNLVVNARDAMPAGGNLTIETMNVELGEEYSGQRPQVAPGSYVMLAVSDSGEGMSSEVKEHIFEPFFTTKEVGRGTGLGLATVYGIVKQAGGFIWVYSEPEQGTTFKVYWPRTEGVEVDPPAPGLFAEPVVGEGRVVLVVEDEPSLRRAAKRILERSGFLVEIAENGGEALLKMKRTDRRFDLVLTDVVMPIMSGKELVEELRKAQPELRVIYMSGYTDNAIVHHAVLDEGAIFLHKPFSPEGLLDKVQIAFAR